MQNARECFGALEFIKHTKDSTSRIWVHVDQAVLEPAKDERAQARAHLLSIIGGDSELGALWAGVTEGALSQMRGAIVAASLGSEAQCFRGRVMVPGRTRPVRHSVAISAELAETKPGADSEGTRTILFDDDPDFVLFRIYERRSAHY